MASVTIISVGTLKEGYLREAVDEYKKRLSQYAKVEITELREERIANEDDKSEIERALDKEADKILASIPRDSYSVAMCVEGKEASSEELADIVERAADSTGKLTLIIGSSHGLSERVKSECKLRLSCSRLTFPHQLMRVLLLEALYRSFTIIHGKRYHK